MTGFSRAKRASDFDMMQVLPAAVLVAVMLIGGDWVGETAEEADAQRARQAHALSIAMEQAGAAMTVDFDRLEPTADFEPMSIDTAMLDTDEASAAGDHEYAVEMRITPLDVMGHIRKVEVRVGYAAASGDRTWVEIATVRQDWDGMHARSRRTRAARHG